MILWSHPSLELGLQECGEPLASKTGAGIWTHGFIASALNDWAISLASNPFSINISDFKLDLGESWLDVIKNFLSWEEMNNYKL